ncbi:sensor histidine kinase [Pedobacter sp. KBW06]|uniref:sensor histidine kinase n=1 Tax=Pedobacter sp. KBW06 TaxID=2153359 RepID=UPI000F5B1A62|nr:sensor histidine kinase [Pedobacter sp. KBW06]RQO74996.1 sensor histidine kinase [Pedobacter sp. KBW06]
MNTAKVESVFQSKWFVYGLRILILYLFSVVFKSFDLTFPHNFSTFLFRGQAFSLMYVLFGLLVWEGAILLSRWMERNTSKENVSRRLLLLCLSLLVYGLIVSFLFGLCYSVFDIVLFHRYDAWESFSSLSYDLYFGIFMFYLLLLGYNGIAFYYKNWKESQLNTERLMRENIQAKYDVLKSQIDPHFFFNSLSVLTNLVYKSPDLSAEYITQLAKSYRYILDKKFENLVSIQTELEFLESYSFLIRIRHQSSIEFDIQINENIKYIGLIPPATLQMLVENAVKHNRFSANDPLHIRIRDEGSFLIVTNDLRKRAVVQNSIGLGLDNIGKRYELTGEKRIEVIETKTLFIVKIPIITTHEDYHI